MLPYPRLAAALIALLAFAAGLAIGRGTAPSPAAPQPAALALSPPPPAPGAAPAPAPAGDALAACERSLKLATDLMDARQREEVGEPVPFPPDLPAEYQPAQVEANARRAMAECPGLNLRVSHVDCAEYPCWIWFEAPKATNGEGLRECPFWKERYSNPGIGSANGTLMGADGERGYWALIETPPGGNSYSSKENQLKRFDARLEEGRERLMEEWGVRELTEEESARSSLAFWRERLAEEPENEAHAQMVRMLEEQLAAGEREER